MAKRNPHAGTSIEALFKELGEPFPPKPRKNLKRVWVSAEKKRGKYTFRIDGANFDAKSLKLFFCLLEGAVYDDTLMVFPVIDELESPALMRKLNKAVADIKSGKAKTVPWETVKKKLERPSRAKKPA